MTRRVLVVAAHPDDELLGCGGTLARHAADGHEVHILILATGATSRSDSRQDEVAALQMAAQKAADVIGAQQPRFAGFPDNRMDSVDLLDVVQAVETVSREIDPQIVYTHHAGDLNIDHQITHRAVLTAFRPLPEATCQAIYTFETLSSTEWGPLCGAHAFQPNHFVDITDTLDRKCAALACYASEMRPFPHPRSEQAINTLAALRGASVGVPAAEAFAVHRQLVRQAAKTCEN